MASNKYTYVSTVEEPLIFFKAFYDNDYLKVLRKKFMPDLKNTNDARHKYHLKIDDTNESYSLEYEVEIEGHVVEDIKGYKTWVTDKTKAVITTFSFKEYLFIRFQFETNEACSNIETSLSREESIDKAKLTCQIWIDNLLHYIGKSKEPQFEKYDELVAFLESIIRYLYNRFKSLCPPTHNNTTIKRILTNKPLFPKTNVEDKSLRYTIFKELLEQTDKQVEPLFKFDTGDSRELSLTEFALIAIAEGVPEKAETEIHFNWEVGTVSYILRKLKEHSPKMQLNLLEESKKVFINNKPFNARSSSKAASTFEINIAKAELKKSIDDLFNSHLM